MEDEPFDKIIKVTRFGMLFQNIPYKYMIVNERVKVQV